MPHTTMFVYVNNMATMVENKKKNKIKHSQRLFTYKTNTYAHTQRNRETHARKTGVKQESKNFYYKIAVNNNV